MVNKSNLTAPDIMSAVKKPAIIHLALTSAKIKKN
jgi:hypothetical protein